MSAARARRARSDAIVAITSSPLGDVRRICLTASAGAAPGSAPCHRFRRPCRTTRSPPAPWFSTLRPPGSRAGGDGPMSQGCPTNASAKLRNDFQDVERESRVRYATVHSKLNLKLLSRGARQHLVDARRCVSSVRRPRDQRRALRRNWRPGSCRPKMLRPAEKFHHDLLIDCSSAGHCILRR